jgi:predicted dehydrogenase
MEPGELRFLVVGCGSIGKRHIMNLAHLNVPHIYAFDIDSARMREVSESFKVSPLGSLDEGWSLNPHVALIVTPTSLHIPLAVEAVKRGCHLFIEKPLSHSLEGVDELLRIVRDRGLVTLVGCNLRFHPGLVRIKQLIDDGAIGNVIAGRAEVGQFLPDWHPWEDYRHMYSAQPDLGGGVILDAIHEIDQIRWMLGEVSEVACFAGKLSRLEITTEDTAAVLLRLSSGAIGEVHMDYVQRTYSRSCHFIGEEGTIRWDYVDGQVRWYSAKTREWKIFLNPPGWEPNQMYLDEMKHFLNCLSQKERPMLDVFEAKRLLEIALAAKSSVQRHQIIRVE